MSDLVAQVCLGSLLHLGQNHGGNLLGSLDISSIPHEGVISAYKVLGVTSVVDLDHGLASLVGELERPVFSVHLNVLVIESSTHHSLGVENSVDGVLSGLILGSITD